MPKARIYQPAKSAMQSGRAKSRGWVLEWEPAHPQPVDSLMGWTGMQDTTREVKLDFATCQHAIEYAQKHGLSYEVAEPHAPRSKPKAYADNFRFDRVKI